jgi:hypothetical protein
LRHRQIANVERGDQLTLIQDQFERFLEKDDGQPIGMLNLLRFQTQGGRERYSGQERPIGRAVVIWARLEANLHDLIWTIRGKGLAEGRGETEKHLVGRLLKELRKIGSGSTETALEVRMAVLAVAGAVKTLSEDRNLIVHGTWGELDGVPTVGSLQLETIDRNEVTFESFPPDRLRDFIRDVIACRDQVTAIIAQVESLRRGPG